MKKKGYPFVDSNFEAILFLSFFEAINAIAFFQFIKLSHNLNIKYLFILFFVCLTFFNHLFIIKKGISSGIHQRYSEMSKFQRKVSLYIGVLYIVLLIAAPIIYNELFK
jgi:hypothetical protein